MLEVHLPRGPPMFERRSLRWPITLGVVMIVLVVVLLVGWAVMAAFGLTFDSERAAFYVTLLSIGATLLTLRYVPPRRKAG